MLGIKAKALAEYLKQDASMMSQLYNGLCGQA
jgi:hypothetical protein